jgi:hypothetical protein
MMNSARKLLWLGLLSSYFGAPVYAADNCSGFFANEMASSETVELSQGNKVTVFTNHNSVSSGDSPYNGLGGCGATVIVMPDGKGWASGSCTLVAANGDSWTYTFSEEVGAGRGTWKAGNGSGQFAKGSKNSGWYEYTVAAGKMASGRWGGTCAQ